MQKIFFVKNGDLQEVNRELSSGFKIVSVNPVVENVSAYGYGGGESTWADHGSCKGEVFAYIVVEKEEE